MQNAIGRLDATQNIPFTTAPAVSNPVGSQCFRVRLVSTEPCFISVGGAEAVYLTSGFPEYFVISPGQAVSVIQTIAPGSLCLSEIA
jgi:hypothetical protein